MKHETLAPGIEIYQGDCLEVMRTLDDNSVDTVVTDPPYGLEFMGKDWDKGVPGIPFWTEMLRVAKPGAILLAMGGTRTYHRLACAIEDAGWDVFDMVEWLYGSGFPKSLSISKSMDKKAGKEREVVGSRNPHLDGGKRKKYTAATGVDYGNYSVIEMTDGEIPITAPATPEAQLWDGWGTALKPAHEPICVAMKPREGTYVNNALKWGVAGFWIDGGRVEANPEEYDITRTSRANKVDKLRLSQVPSTQEKSIPTENKGRWPANLIHDGSDEVLRGFPETGNGNSASRFFYCAKGSRSERNAGLEGMESKEKKTLQPPTKQFVDYDGQKHDTNGDKRYLPRQNHHPTVKPIALMEYLVRLTKTPTGGIVLDPFMGSGTTGIACVNEGREFIGIEQSPEYMEIARRRIEYAMKNLQPRLL